MRTEIFNERITAVQDAKHVIRADSAAKKSLREQLENDVEKFLSNGGSINTLSGIDFKPKQPSKRVERIKPWREVNEAKNNKYEHYNGNTALREWCKAKHNRVLVIAKVMGVPANYISQRIIGRCVVQVDAFKDEYLPAMKAVEKWSRLMKKRNKKYNPKQIVKQKVHKFQMFWEVNEAKRIIEMHHLLNGVDPQESTHTPLHVWMKAHKGDLSLALKTQTIPAEQSFHIVSRVHAKNKETGETVDVEFQLATATIMHLWQFLGDDDADLYVEDGGFKKKWLGFNHELEKYLESIEGDFEIVTNHCCLTCFSTFKSFRHELEFKSVKLMNPEFGLGVSASVAEAKARKGAA